MWCVINFYKSIKKKTDVSAHIAKNFSISGSISNVTFLVSPGARTVSRSCMKMFLCCVYAQSKGDLLDLAKNVASIYEKDYFYGPKNYMK